MTITEPLYARYRLMAVAAILSGLSISGTGCSDTAIQPKRNLLLRTTPPQYSIDDWDMVLSDSIHDGLVDYGRLAGHREPLERYYALVGATGPRLTPDQFPTPQAKTAYWINVYNALTLLAVLRRYPTDTMYDLSLPPLEQEYKFIVDGKLMNLDAIEAQMLKDSRQDVRSLFATSRAAIGTPRLMSSPYRPEVLDVQLSMAASWSLDNPNLCQIDHANKSILIWQEVLKHEADFLDYGRDRYGIQTASLFNVLLEMAAPGRRKDLQVAMSYPFREIPFNRKINSWSPSAPSTEE